MSQIRRRQFGRKVGNGLLYPDAFMVIFSADAGQCILMNESSITRYIIDGIEVIPNNMVDSVTVSTNGNHVVYFWLGKSARLKNESIARYVRIPDSPEYWHSSFLYTNYVIRKLDFLGEVPPSLASNFGMRYNWQTNKIEVRVPVGCGSAYNQALSATDLKNQTIVETSDFSIDINELFT